MLRRLRKTFCLSPGGEPRVTQRGSANSSQPNARGRAAPETLLGLPGPPDLLDPRAAKAAKRDARRIESAIERELAVVRGDPDSDEAIVQPTRKAEALIADDYLRRYGVDIKIIARAEDMDAAFSDRLQQLGDFKVGFLVPGNGRLISRAHVTPVVLMRRGEETAAITYDSANGSLAWLWARRHAQHVYVGDAPRQIDEYSCHTDALVLLKDVLRRPDPLADLRPNGDLGEQTHPVKVPAYLLKTVQNPKFAAEAFTDEALRTRISEKKPKTLAQHRAQHTRTVHVARTRGRSETRPGGEVVSVERRWNMFLNAKGREFAAHADSLFDAAIARGGPAAIDAIVKDRVVGSHSDVEPPAPHGA